MIITIIGMVFIAGTLSVVIKMIYEYGKETGREEGYDEALRIINDVKNF